MQPIIGFIIIINIAIDIYRGNIFINKTRLWFTSATMLFATAAVLNPRALEYLIPLAAINLSIVIKNQKPPIQSIFCGILMLCLSFQSIPMVFPYFTSANIAPKKTGDQGRLSAIKAVSSLPNSHNGAMVFNCTYNTGPYILYLRPNMQFIDLLDPRLYRNTSPTQYLLRNKLVHGKIKDPYHVLKASFSAQYVVCMCAGLIKQMERDHRFQRLYPDPKNPRNTFAKVWTYMLLDE